MGSVAYPTPGSPLFTQPFIRAQIKENNQSSASLAFVRGIHQGPVNSPHKWPVTLKMFPFDDVILCIIFSVQWIRIRNHEWTEKKTCKCWYIRSWIVIQFPVVRQLHNFLVPQPHGNRDMAKLYANSVRLIWITREISLATRVPNPVWHHIR